MRGKRCRESCRPRPRRLIPAHAGKTVIARSKSSGRGAHPRACGENLIWNSTHTQSPGSSPRMRGKRFCPGSQLRLCRLIPAHAGKTVMLMSTILNMRAHPRACGENRLCPHKTEFLPGSSPRMRGKQSGRVRAAVQQRLIPAHAGKTQPRPASRYRLWAHPRACGENDEWKHPIAGLSGSSPRMRGKLSDASEDGSIRRLIPAHAGKTSLRAPRRWRSRAHPRACGENAVDASRLEERRGSSPRMRGKRLHIYPGG